jgi:hypothetical protein
MDNLVGIDVSNVIESIAVDVPSNRRKIPILASLYVKVSVSGWGSSVTMVPIVVPVARRPPSRKPP